MSATTDVGLSVVEGVSNGLTPFKLPSKRNIGLAGESVRGRENTPILMTSQTEALLKVGGYNNAMYGPTILRNLFKNAQKATNVYFLRIVGAASTVAKKITTITGTAINMTVQAGQNGSVDKGNWGNDLAVYLYAYGTISTGKWYMEVYYKGKLVETYDGLTCASLASQINQNSNYIVIDFDAEPNIALCSQSGTGTISTITSPTSETLATAEFQVSVAGSAGNIITLMVGTTIVLGSYTVQSGDTATLVAAGLKASVNAGMHGYSMANTGADCVITGPTSSGAALNGISLTFNYVGTVHTVEATAGDYTFTGGVSSSPANVSATVTGVGTLFTGQLAVGGALFTTAGNYIGKIAAIASNTSLTLTALSQESLSAVNFKFSPFYVLGGQLAGGTYIAPNEADFYPLPDLVSPKGLACFDGTDVQIIGVTEFHTLTMAVQGRDYCASRKDALFVANLPLSASEQVLKDYARTLQSNNTSFIAGYNFWVKTSDDLGGFVWVPGIGCQLGAGFVRVPYQQGDFIHIPPAGEGAAFVDIIDVAPKIISQETLNRYTNNYTVNSVIFEEGKGWFPITSRTYSTSLLFMSIHIRMMTSFYVRALRENLGWTRQKPNTPELKKQLYIATYGFFKTEYANGAIERSIPMNQAVVIICDQTNNPVTQDRKQLNEDIDWIPTECTEAVKISLNRNDGALLLTVLNEGQ